MKLFSTVAGALGLLATLVPARAHAQDPFDLRPDLTKAQFRELTRELGSVLRFRQLGDTTPVGRGNVDISALFGNSPVTERLGRAASFPRIVARLGVSDRVDVGAWGGVEHEANYGMAGVDTKIMVLAQGPRRPVSVSIRPSVTSLIGPANILAGNASIDLAVSRTFGAFSPYAGVATSASAAMERSKDLVLDPVAVDESLSYAGISYRWRALVASAEVEKGTRVSYAFRLGSRF
jgi:hypothetical protein